MIARIAWEQIVKVLLALSAEAMRWWRLVRGEEK